MKTQQTTPAQPVDLTRLVRPCGTDNVGTTHLLNPFPDETNDLPGETMCGEFWEVGADDYGPPNCPKCLRYWQWAASLKPNDQALPPEGAE